jgi:hypothetical protein
MMKKTVAVMLCVISTAGTLRAQDNPLTLAPEDVIIEQSTEGGYDFWIRQKHGVGSVLLTESNSDPAWRHTNYALRNPVWHPVNGNEKRLLDGLFIDPALKLFSLIDSTIEPHPRLGRAFHIFVPFVVVYGGYPGERAGEMEIRDNLFINFLTFSKPYADYTGAFHDNPFRLAFTQAPLSASREKALLSETDRSFKEIADKGGGAAYAAVNREDIGTVLDRIVGRGEGENLDLALCLDTTDSMADDIDAVKQGLLDVMRKYRGRYRNLRVGVVFYKDYFDEYLTKIYPFSDDYARVERTISGAVVRGGRDTPEAVYEALSDALHKLQWRADRRIIILVGDAPPHPLPRGKVTKEQVFHDAAAAQVTLHTIILPQ